MVPAEIHKELSGNCEIANQVKKLRDADRKDDPRATWEEFKTIPQTVEMIIPLGRAYHPRYDSYKERIESFTRWPAKYQVNVTRLAQAGFYYENKVDFVRCFYCNGGIMDWEENDDPFLRHSQMYSSCLYMRAVKGDQYIQQAVQYPNEILMHSQNEEYTPIELQCQYCASRKIRVALSPCGHIGGCGVCAHKQKLCPICRRKVMGRFSINF
jgi:hypothetical protein